MNGKVHWPISSYGDAACGSALGLRSLLTTVPHQVTCARCQRTWWWKSAAQKAPA